MDDRTHAMRRRRRLLRRLLLRRKISRLRARCRSRGPVGLTATAKKKAFENQSTPHRRLHKPFAMAATAAMPWLPWQLGRKDPDQIEPRRTLAKKMCIDSGPEDFTSSTRGSRCALREPPAVAAAAEVGLARSGACAPAVGCDTMESGRAPTGEPSCGDCRGVA